MFAIVKLLTAVGEILGKIHDDSLIGIADRVVEFAEPRPLFGMNVVLLHELALDAVNLGFARVKLVGRDFPKGSAKRMAPLAFKNDRAVGAQGDHARRAAVAKTEALARTSVRENDVLLDHFDEAPVKEHMLGNGGFGQGTVLALGAGNGSLKLRIGGKR